MLQQGLSALSRAADTRFNTLVSSPWSRYSVDTSGYHITNGIKFFLLLGVTLLLYSTGLLTTPKPIDSSLIDLTGAVVTSSKPVAVMSGL